ncbi:MAG: hypothetical protein ACWA6X_00355 [Bauldia sp.]
MTTRRVIRLEPSGGLGNRMLQLMFAETIRLAVPDVLIAGQSLPDWGLESPPDVPKPGPFGLICRGHVQPIADITRLFGSLPQVDLYMTSLALRCAYFRDHRAYFDGYFRSTAEAYPVGDNELLLSIRLGDILQPTHLNYLPMPLAWYEQLIGETGLSPVFLGQLGDDLYSTALRKRFASARFLPTGSAQRDFATLRSARHVAIAVSTFSWLATWLSARAETIHVPIAGLFHPAARPDIDALPIHDGRYRFYWSELRSWSATADELQRLTEDAVRFEPIAPGELIARVPGIGTDGTQMVTDASGTMPTELAPFRPLGTIPGAPDATRSAVLRRLRDRLGFGTPS